MKAYKGKAIYNPSGKAGEYSYWACNFYKGCSNGCSYCYLKKGILAGALGGSEPTLKKCFKHETDALERFNAEMMDNIDDLRLNGLFFSFTTDPMLPETINLTWDAVGMAVYKKIPVKILTKRTEWVDDWINDAKDYEGGWENPELYAFGFTLTGFNGLEPNASKNHERIKAIEKLSVCGYKTFASIEPIIDFAASWNMITQAINSGCNHFKIGLESGKKYNVNELKRFMVNVHAATNDKTTIYWKDSLLKLAQRTRESLPRNCVNRDFNIWRGK